MPYLFKFPDIGEGLDEGTIQEWYVKEGDTIKKGDPLVNIETDKVTTDIPSPVTGIVKTTHGQEGEVIKVGDVLVEIRTDEDEKEYAPQPVQSESEYQESVSVVGTFDDAGNEFVVPPSKEGFLSEEETGESVFDEKVRATPVARKIAKEKNVNLEKIKGTGIGGRIRKEDVFSSADNPEYDWSPLSLEIKESNGNMIEYETLSQIRKVIAKNMMVSKQNAAHMSLFDEVEISELMRIRNQFKPQYEKKGVKLTYLSFIIKATSIALKRNRVLNVELDSENNRLIYKKYYNIGIAVDTPKGLMVPVIRNVERLTIYQIAARLMEISEKARKNQITLDDMKDGTFSISNYGNIGGQFAVPIINYPEVGILGVGRLHEKPIVQNGDVAVGNMLPLSLSVDHRVVDGAEVAHFMNNIMELLREPVSLMME